MPALWIIVLVLGVVIGLVVGRWWALFAAVAFGVLAWKTMNNLEVSRGVLALGYGGFAALGIAAGVFVRKLARKRSET